MGTRAAAQNLYGLPDTWQDDQARPWAMSALQGHYSVVTLAYGACRRICSTSLRLMEQVQAQADAEGRPVDFVVISINPSEDRPADWAAYRRERKLLRDNWHFLIGSPQAVAKAARLLRVRIWRIDAHLMHDFRLALISPSGEIVRTMDHFDEPISLLLP